MQANMQLMPPPTSHARGNGLSRSFLTSQAELMTTQQDAVGRCWKCLPPPQPNDGTQLTRGHEEVFVPQQCLLMIDTVQQKAKAWASIRGLQLHGVLKHSELKNQLLQEPHIILQHAFFRTQNTWVRYVYEHVMKSSAWNASAMQRLCLQCLL